MTLLLCGILLLSLLPNASPPHMASPGPAQSTAAAQVDTYESAVVDANGSLRIITSDGRTVVVPKEGKQSSFDKPIVSADRTAVGAPALYPNCCTSYDIPLQLVVYTDGTLHRLTGIGLPIFDWHFADRGTRVAFGQQPVHFGCTVHYELRDTRSGRLIESVDVPQPCGQNPDPRPVKVPSWIDELNAARK